GSPGAAPACRLFSDTIRLPSAATLVSQARGTLQTSAPDVSQLAAADITRSL
ncbi:hypothetical protein HIN56_20005, partial [Salmonella enterica subsp. enterica serovar Choleraesuis]|nr:hypothetical protein [Salmonella enterica subsp. enterica serovar Choleraesuis]